MGTFARERSRGNVREGTFARREGGQNSRVGTFARRDGGHNSREGTFARRDGGENSREGTFARGDLQGHRIQRVARPYCRIRCLALRRSATNILRFNWHA